MAQLQNARARGTATFNPTRRRQEFFGSRRKEVGEILQELCRQKDIEVMSGHARSGHVHMLLSVSRKYAVAFTIGYLKGKSVVRIHRELLITRGTLFGRAFWSRGYCVSTVGLDGAMIRKYIENQDKYERDQERGLFD